VEEGSVELPEAIVARLLETWPVAILATLAPDGRPHQVPIVFVHHAKRFWSPVDGKPKAGSELARLRHVARDARVGLLLERYDEDWRRLWWIRVDGEAAVVGAREEPAFDGVASRLRRKYPQYAATPLFSGEPTLIRVDPSQLRSWCAAQETLP
jgi:PPOX class probable F420-dependent enzyme